VGSAPGRLRKSSAKYRRRRNRFDLLPVKLTENRFAISQRVSIPILNRTIVRIVISTGGPTVIGNGAYCTISGDDVVVPQP
jgi:hypothetical protein